MLSNARFLLAQRLMRRLAKRPKQGFTLIELLVVVVIIGILASVALPSFVGAQDKARNSAVQGNTNTVRMALEQYSTDNNGSYPTALQDAQFKSNNYLPGNKLPRSPWGTTAQASDIGASGTPFVTAASVSGGTTMPSQGQEIADGAVVTIPASTQHYGAVSYNLDGGSQTYVLYGTGKKGKKAVIGTAVSNAGQ